MHSDKAYTAKVDMLAGATAGLVTDLIFYGLDSYKIMRQNNQQFRAANLFRGFLPSITMGSATSFGVFFGLYNVSKSRLDAVEGCSEGTAVLIASVVAGVPSSFVGIPADTVKKRMVLHSQSAAQSCAFLYRSFGWKGFFIGWQANLVKDIPFIALKMTLYEGMARAYLHLMHGPTDRPKDARKLTGGARCGADVLSGGEAAGIGFASGLATAVLTAPLDTINTRLKSGGLPHDMGLLTAGRRMWAEEGVASLFRGLGPRALIVSLGSTFFWSLYASCRAAFQEAL